MSLPPPLHKDAEHLRLLSIFHYVLGGITALFAFFPLIYLAMGIAMLAAPESFGNGANRPPEPVGWILIGIGAFFFVVGETLAVGMIASGRLLARRRRYQLIFAVACVECLMMPLGTVLGVFTIITLTRPTVKELFQGPAAGGLDGAG